MKTKTHFLIAKIAAIRAGLNSAEQLVFSLGAAAPDLLPTQFLHPHFYQSSAKYVFRRLMRLENKSTFLALFQLGEMAHYVCDFCCAVHSNGKIGNIREHIGYELRLQKYFIDNYSKLMSAVNKHNKYKSLEKVIDEYLNGEDKGYYRDICSAVYASIAVCRLYERATVRRRTANANI